MSERQSCLGKMAVKALCSLDEIFLQQYALN